MINIDYKEFNTVNSLQDFLKQTTDTSEPLAILGGHFLLDYSQQEKALVPLIIGETNDEQINRTAKEQVSDFPEKTFSYAVSLYRHFAPLTKTKIMLLVNDHQIPSLKQLPYAKDLSKLRPAFYQRYSDSIPKIFVKILDKYQLNVNDVLLENQSAGMQTGLKGSKYLFSEYIYRKRFDRSLKDKILKYEDYFYAQTRANGKRDVYLKNNTLNHTCLTKDGSCGCSGEIMEFIYKRVLQDQLKNFILFVPSSCYGPVSSGIVSIQHFLRLEHNINDLKVSLVSHLPCENTLNFFNYRISFQKFYYE